MYGRHVNMEEKINVTVENAALSNSNMSQTTTELELERAYNVQFVCYSIVIPMISCAGLIGNTFAIITLCKRRNVPGSITVLLNGLVVTDTAIIVLSLITMTMLSLSMNSTKLSYFQDVIYPNIFPVCNFLIMTIQQSNVWLTVALALERYIAICHPFSSVHLRTKKKSIIVFSLILIFSILYNFPRLFAFAINYKIDEKKSKTHYEIGLTDFGKGEFYLDTYSVLMYTVFIYIIPIFLLISFSIPTIRQLINMGKKLKSIKQQLYKEVNMTAFILAVVACFLLCQTPGIFAQLQNVFSAATTVALFSVTNTIFVFNSSINFFIYTMSSRFTRVFKRLGLGKNGRNSNSITMSRYILMSEGRNTKQTDV